MRKQPPPLPVLALLALLCLAGAPALAQNPEGARCLIPPPVLSVDAGDDEARAALLAGHLGDMLAAELADAGFAVLRTSDGPYTDAEARKAGYRWLARSGLSIRGGIATVSLEIGDTQRGLVVAAENFAAWAGPTLVPLIDGAAGRAAAAAGKARHLSSEARPAPLEEPSRFLSPDEGARVELRPAPEGAGKLYAASVVGGEARLGPLPLPQGSRVQILVTKSGKLPYRAELILEGGGAHSLPPLRDDPPWGLLLGLGSGHLPGLRLGASYHPPGGWFFVPLDAYLALGLPAGPGAHASYRGELRLGFGSYLLWGPDSAFRAGLEAKGGAVLSGTIGSPAFVFLDPLVEPIALFGEYALSRRLLLRLEVGGSFALGLGSLGVMSRGWLASPSLDLALEWKP